MCYTEVAELGACSLHIPSINQGRSPASALSIGIQNSLSVTSPIWAVLLQSHCGLDSVQPFLSTISLDLPTQIHVVKANLFSDN